jgi:cobalt-zinc-cadmium efflux system outer membrane protein
VQVQRPQRPRRRARLIGLSLTGLALAFGLQACQSYHPLPLDEEAVNAALTFPTDDALRIRASELEHPILQPIPLDFSDGLTPDEAGLIAVLANPSLRAARDARALADAQLLQAGILPNPQLSFDTDFPTGGNTAGEVNAWGLGLDWEVTSLITRSAKLDAATAQQKSVSLDIAWREWQTAQAARIAVTQLIVFEAQTKLAQQMSERLQSNLAVVRDAVQRSQLTALDLAAAESAANQARATLLDLRGQAEQQRLRLNRAVGLPSDRQVPIQTGSGLPTRIELPSDGELTRGLEQRRLDLVALRRAYDAQEANVRRAVLEQFPSISLGFHRTGDTGGFYDLGFGISISIPIFDRNQGNIALERATRQQLFDEYTDRLFEARSDVALLASRIRSLNGQIAAGLDAEPSFERLVDTYRTAVEQRQADVLSYYQAWSDLNQKRIDVLSLQQQLEQARSALEIATGIYHVGEAPSTAEPVSPESGATP